MNDTAKPALETQWIDNAWKATKALSAPLLEVFYGAKGRAIPWAQVFLSSATLCLVLSKGWDRKVFILLRLPILYPTNPILYLIYSHTLIVSPLYLWGCAQVGERKKLQVKLTEVFRASNLKNAIGKMPGYVHDRAIDEVTRRLRLTNAGLSKDDFQKTKPNLEAHLGIYIDEIQHDIGSGLVDVIYSHIKMLDLTGIDEIQKVTRWHFVVGRTRSRQMTACLLQVPHLLIAGQTGGGKSTFLHQFITTLYLNHKDVFFTLIDLKGGTELALYNSLKRVKFVDKIEDAISELLFFDSALTARMAILRANKCRDLEEFVNLPPEKRKTVEGIPDSGCTLRHIVVIDEAAEMFLAGYHGNSDQIQKARRILSQIARQGRSVGIHLVVATQRPDSKSIDPQIKANLTGIICFQMVNDASSINVLGNGRATELTAVPGRAIWKCGAEQVEVQTPFLSWQEISTLLSISKPEDETLPNP